MYEADETLFNHPEKFLLLLLVLQVSLSAFATDSLPPIDVRG